MSCDAPIQTGRPLGPTVGGSTATNRAASGVLFDTSSVSTFSRNIVITAGTTARVSVFFPVSGVSSDYISINRLVMSSADMPQAQACAPCPPGRVEPVGPFVPLSEREEVTNGKPWRLSTTNNTMLIDVPGTYRLQMSDDSMAGNVYAEYDMFQVSIHLTPVHAGWAVVND